MQTTIVFWAVLLVAFIAIEFATTGLTAIWFALGSVGALISAAVAPSVHMLWLQVLIFLVISGTSMYFTRPIVKKYVTVEEIPTNANRVLAMTGIVREDIHNNAGTGLVFVGGKLWTARTEDASIIAKDSPVRILRIEGVKLIVAAQAEDHSTTQTVVESNKKTDEGEENGC